MDRCEEQSGGGQHGRHCQLNEQQLLDNNPAADPRLRTSRRHETHTNLYRTMLKVLSINTDGATNPEHKVCF